MQMELIPGEPCEFSIRGENWRLGESQSILSSLRHFPRLTKLRRFNATRNRRSFQFQDTKSRWSW